MAVLATDRKCASPGADVGPSTVRTAAAVATPLDHEIVWWQTTGKTAASTRGSQHGRLAPEGTNG